MEELHDRIRKTRRMRDLSGAEVAERLGISTQYYYNIERGRRKLSAENAIKLAEIFNVPLDYLAGKSVGALIEERLKLKGISFEDLAERAKVKMEFLRNIDEVVPNPWDYEALDRVADVLFISPQILRSALSLQEPPLDHNDGSRATVEEDFADVHFDEPDTIAAHHEGDDWTDDELEELKRFKEFLKSKRK